MRPSHAINFRYPRHLGCVQQPGIDRTVLTARRAHHDFPTACHFRQRHRHQRSGDQRRGAAGNVHPNTPERIKFLPHSRALRVTARPTLAQTLLVEPADVMMRKANGSLEFAVDLTGRLGNLCVADLQCLSCKFRAIKFLGKLQQRRVALGCHTLDNVARVSLDLGIKKARGRAQAIELVLKAGIGMAQFVHQRRSETDEEANVKRHPLALTD